MLRELSFDIQLVPPVQNTPADRVAIYVNIAEGLCQLVKQKVCVVTLQTINVLPHTVFRKKHPL